MNRNRRQEKEDLDELKDPLLDDGDTRGIDDWEPISFGHSFDRLPGTPRLPFEKSLTKIAASWFVAVLFLGLLVCRLVTLVFKAVDETRCFFQIHSLQCRNFSIFNYFKEGNTTGWLCASALTSAICLIALPTIPEFRGYKYAIRKFIGRSHFYSISFLLVCVLVYHALLMWRSEVPINRAIAGLFMSEKILATCTVFAFNFLRPPGSHDSYPALRVSYNASVVSALIENTYLFFRVSLDTTFQISSKEKFSQLDDSMNAIMVMLIAIEATFRWSLVSFFWSKLFHGRKDIFSNMNHLDDI